MKKYLLGAFIMLVMLKPAVGIALVSIFAEGMQTAAAAMANGASARQIDAAASASLIQQGKGVAQVIVEESDDEEADQQVAKKKKKEEVFEDRVMSLIEKRIQHEQEQKESQRKLAEADAAAKAEKAGVELFDEEFKKKFPKKD